MTAAIVAMSILIVLLLVLTAENLRLMDNLRMSRNRAKFFEDKVERLTIELPERQGVAPYRVQPQADDSAGEWCGRCGVPAIGRAPTPTTEDGVCRLHSVADCEACGDGEALCQECVFEVCGEWARRVPFAERLSLAAHARSLLDRGPLRTVRELEAFLAMNGGGVVDQDAHVLRVTGASASAISELRVRVMMGLEVVDVCRDLSSRQRFIGPRAAAPPAPRCGVTNYAGATCTREARHLPTNHSAPGVPNWTGERCTERRSIPAGRNVPRTWRCLLDVGHPGQHLDTSATEWDRDRCCSVSEEADDTRGAICNLDPGHTGAHQRGLRAWPVASEFAEVCCGAEGPTGACQKEDGHGGYHQRGESRWIPRPVDCDGQPLADPPASALRAPSDAPVETYDASGQTIMLAGVTIDPAVAFRDPSRVTAEEIAAAMNAAAASGVQVTVERGLVRLMETVSGSGSVPRVGSPADRSAAREREVTRQECPAASPEIAALGRALVNGMLGAGTHGLPVTDVSPPKAASPRLCPCPRPTSAPDHVVREVLAVLRGDYGASMVYADWAAATCANWHVVEWRRCGAFWEREGWRCRRQDGHAGHHIEGDGRGNEWNGHLSPGSGRIDAPRLRDEPSWPVPCWVTTATEAEGWRLASRSDQAIVIVTEDRVPMEVILSPVRGPVADGRPVPTSVLRMHRLTVQDDVLIYDDDCPQPTPDERAEAVLWWEETIQGRMAPPLQLPWSASGYGCPEVEPGTGHRCGMNHAIPWEPMPGGSAVPPHVCVETDCALHWGRP